MHSHTSALPLVSIITPNYNGERFIRRVVESVRKQNYSVQHIIVDDCSSDFSWSLLVELANQYHWLCIFRLEERVGPIAARNQAIKLAQGRYLAFLDVDDFWLPEKLKIQIEFMSKNNCQISFTDYRLVSDNGRKIGRLIKGLNQINLHQHFMTRYIGCSTVIIDYEKNKDFKILNPHPSYRGEDFLSWANCIIKSGFALRCPFDLARYTKVNNSRSSKRVKAAISIFYIYLNYKHIKKSIIIIYYFIYIIFVFWKNIWFRPLFERNIVDPDYEWTLISKNLD